MCTELLVFSEEGEASMVPSANATNRNSLGSVVLLINEENNDLEVPAVRVISGLLASAWLGRWSLHASFRVTEESAGSAKGHSSVLAAWRRRSPPLPRVPGNRCGALWKSQRSGAPSRGWITFPVELLPPFPVSAGSEVSLACKWIFFHSNKYSTHQPINLRKF